MCWQTFRWPYSFASELKLRRFGLLPAKMKVRMLRWHCSRSLHLPLELPPLPFTLSTEHSPKAFAPSASTPHSNNFLFPLILRTPFSPTNLLWRGSTALGPWSDLPLTLFSKGKDDFGRAKANILERIKASSMAQGKHKTKTTGPLLTRVAHIMWIKVFFAPRC